MYIQKHFFIVSLCLVATLTLWCADEATSVEHHTPWPAIFTRPELRNTPSHLVAATLAEMRNRDTDTFSSIEDLKKALQRCYLEGIPHAHELTTAQIIKKLKKCGSADLGR